MAQPAPKTDDRRIAERVSLEVEVSMTSENNFYTGFTHDISEGGVFFASHEVLPLGTELTFSLKLGKGVVHCQGVVRWVREPSPYLDGVPPGMGVQFHDLSPTVQAAINEFIGGRRESIFFDDDPM
jgi:uncharacterized protein (TIGR02266 family)